LALPIRLAGIKPPVAINYFYDEAKGKLSAQISQLDALDTKLGLTLGFLAIIGGVIFALKAADFGAGYRLVIGILTIVPIGLAAYAAILIRGGYLDAPDPSTLDVLRGANVPEDIIKTVMLPNVISAFQNNRPVLAQKSLLLNIANGGLGLAVAILLVLRLLGLVQPG
jgi:hypothetical protein